ncbi:MAG: serine hydrolase domain-containing protein [Pseudomonadota bacterium]|nr:serine hydrolase domain-containing protein [Pseudomonadota bacterium]
MKIVLSRLLVLVLICCTAEIGYAREISSVKPEREGVSSARLIRITDHMEKRVADGTMVGGMGVIARNGSIVYSQVYGQADREAGTPMEEDTIHRIYSMTKPITALAVMMLYEQGHFFLNDPIARYIPEMADLEVALSTAGTNVLSDGTQSRTIGQGDDSLIGQTRKPRRQPTIRDLLTHTAGLTYGIFGNTEVDKLYRESAVMGGNLDLKEFVTRLGQLPLQYEPGTQWHYSVAVDVQGRLVEVISGMRFGEFLEERIFEPLDMTDTYFTLPKDKVSRLAQLYAPKGVRGANFFAPSTSPGLDVADPAVSRGFVEGTNFESGGGGLVSTARDYLRFAQLMLNGGELDGVRLLSPKTVELMTANHLGDIPMGFNRTGTGFGLGYGLVLDPGQVGEVSSKGEFNWGGAAGTRFWIDPVENLIGLFMVQSLPHRTRLGQEFKVLTYQALIE